MAETQTASSPIEMQDPFNGQTPTLREFNDYRVTGEVPARFQVEETVEEAESATADAPEQTAESQPDAQEPPKVSEAEKRIKQLLSEKKELERKLAQTVKPDVSASSPAPQQVPLTRPKPTLNDKNDDGSLRYGDYAEFIADVGAWSAEQTLYAVRQREVQQQQHRQIEENIEEAKRRYGQEYDDVIEPTAGAIMGNQAIPAAVKQMMANSDVLPELVYTIGTDQKTMKELERLSRVNPAQAIRYIATLEVGIRQKLAAEENPAPEPKRTAAPKPPAPVTGASSRAFDVSDDSLSPEEWMRKRNAQLARRGK